MNERAIDRAQLAALAAALEAARATLERDASATHESSKPVDLELSIGRLSRVDALQQQHMAIARRDRSAVQVQQIRAALARVDAGTYGDCLECGEPIGYARLEARPEAPFCRRCQEGRR